MRVKSIIIGSFLFLGFTVVAKELETKNSLRNYVVGECSHWTVMGSGNSVFGCATYPFNVRVPDYYDVVDELERAFTKISDLEKRVKELESRIP